MAYVDGFVTAVPTARKEEYVAMCRAVWPLFQAYGATRYRECWADDVPDGELTSFPMAVRKRDEETVAFSWIEWPDRITRNACYASMETDPRWGEFSPDRMPFDGQRMIYGGFEVVFEA
jgi:uncharacterized protein YbaA (DUF1428 family)